MSFGPWELAAFGTLYIGAIILALDTGLRMAPVIQERFETLKKMADSGLWGFAPLVLLTISGAIFLANELGWVGQPAKPHRDQSSVSSATQPSLVLLPPKARYMIAWDPHKQMIFDFQREGARLGIGQYGNPGLVLHNPGDVTVGDVTVAWDVEIADYKQLAKIGPLANFDINFPDDYTMEMVSKPPEFAVPNVRYNPNLHGETKLTFVARDTDLWFPIGIGPIVGLFLVAKMPHELGAKTEALPIHLSITWNVPSMGSTDYRIRIRGVNASPNNTPGNLSVIGYMEVEIDKLN